MKNKLALWFVTICLVMIQFPAGKLITFAEEADTAYIPDADVVCVDDLSEDKNLVDEAIVDEIVVEEDIFEEADTAAENYIEGDEILEDSFILDEGVYAEADPDTIPPVLNLDSLTVTLPVGKDKVTVGDTVVFSIDASDDRCVREVKLQIQSPVTGNGQYVPMNYTGTDETMSGTYKGEFTITDGTENGTWHLFAVSAFDTSSNEVSYSNKIIWGPGNTDLSAYDFEVSGTSSDPDITAPVIDLSSLQVTLPDNKDKATVGDTIIFSVNVSDDRCVREVKLQIQSPVTGNGQYVPMNYTGTDETMSGTYKGEFTITDDTENGTWHLFAVGAFDTSSNEVSYSNKVIWRPGNTDLSAYDFEVSGTSSDPDITAPVIDLSSLQVTLPDNKDKATVGDTIIFSVNASDERCVREVKLQIQSPVTGNGQYVPMNYTGTDETMSGTYKGEFTITDVTENGTWHLFAVGAFDTSSNEVSYSNKVIWGPGNTDLSAYDFEVTSPDCPLDLTTSGYSMMLDGDGATTVFGGNYYINAAGETITPNIKVRFEDETGWTTLAPRKYTLIYEKKTGEDTWEEYTGTSFGVDNTGRATYRVSATGNASLYYTGTVSPVEFNVIKKNTVTFVSSYDNSVIETVVVDSGNTVCAIDAPVICDNGEGGDGKPFIFYGWGTDPDLTKYVVGQAHLYDFEVPVNQDMTLYAIYRTSISFIATPGGSVSSGVWGGSYSGEANNFHYLGDQVNTTIGYAKADEGVRFLGWRIGSAQGEDAAEKGISSNEGTDWNGDNINTIYVPGDHNYTLYAVFGHIVTFDSRGGSEVSPQYVISGEKVTEPKQPTKEGLYFERWCSDEELTNRFWFSDSINTDITLYADWYANMAIGVYDKSNPGNNKCGTIDVEAAKQGGCHSDIRVMNITEPDGSVKFTAKPAEGYAFKGWYKGVIGSSAYVESPSDELLCGETEYTVNAKEAAICAVFECAGHQWEMKVQKATPDADGRIYRKCTVCKTEETVAPLLKVNSITLEGTSYTYTGKAIEPKVTVANASEVLAEDQYTVEYSNNVNAGTAKVKVTLKGDYYEGSRNLTFTITKPEGSGNNNTGSGGTDPSSGTTVKKANPMTVKGRKVTIDYKKLKKKTQKIKHTKAIKISDAKGKISYRLAGVNKKKYKKYFKVNAQTGKITVKKGLKKGTYKVTVKVKAEGDSEYSASDEIAVMIKIKVK